MAFGHRAADHDSMAIGQNPACVENGTASGHQSHAPGIVLMGYAIKLAEAPVSPNSLGGGVDMNGAGPARHAHQPLTAKAQIWGVTGIASRCVQFGCRLTQVPGGTRGMDQKGGRMPVLVDDRLEFSGGELLSQHAIEQANHPWVGLTEIL